MASPLAPPVLGIPARIFSVFIFNFALKDFCPWYQKQYT